MSRTQCIQYDGEASKSKRIKLSRRDYSSAEISEIDSRLDDLKHGSLLKDDEDDDENLSDNIPEKSEETSAKGPGVVSFDSNETSEKYGNKQTLESSDDEQEFDVNATGRGSDDSVDESV